MDEILGWIGDAGFVVNPTGTEVEAGFVIVPTDPDKASNLFGTLKTFISLGGGTVGLAVSDEAYGDTTITTVSVDLAKLGGVAGGLSGGATDGLGIPAGTFELSFAVDGDVVVIGTGPALREARPRHHGRHLAQFGSRRSATPSVGSAVTPRA